MPSCGREEKLVQLFFAPLCDCSLPARRVTWPGERGEGEAGREKEVREVTCRAEIFHRLTVTMDTCVVNL